MSEKKKICQFKVESFPDYKCPEFALEDSEKGYCIFHEPRKDKDIKKFKEGINRKLDEKDYNFKGYWFPVSFSLPPQYTFEEGADFRGATFEKEADFGLTTFEEGAYFGGTTFKEKAGFGGATFKKPIFLDKIEIKDPTYADILFRKAKILWHNEGNYVEEGKCHYQEMDYIRKQKNWFFRYFFDNIFHRCLHGYGEKPHRVILGAVAITIVCAFLFMNFGIGETRFLTGSNLPTYNIPKILFRLYNLSLSDLANIGRYFYFSTVTFTTLGYGDLRPVHPVSHLISSIEAFVGMFMMALFVLTYGRKWRR